MSPKLNYVQIWEGENRPNIAYEQIVENGVSAWTRAPLGGLDPGCSWMVTFGVTERRQEGVHNPAVIPQSLTARRKRSRKKLSGPRSLPQRWKSRENA